MAATTLTDRNLVRLSGEDVRGFLQGLVTSDVAGELPVWAGLLTPQGKCLFDFIVWEDANDLLLDCEAAAADELIKRLSIYRLRRQIRVERDPSLAVHWSKDGGEGVPDPRLPQLGRRWLAPADESASGWLEHRLNLGVCEGRAELGDLLWLECNAAELNGVSFTKGCFVGQENTARMNWRQKINRRLFVTIGGGGERARAEYPQVDRSVVPARVDAIPDNAIVPDWLKAALAQPTTA
ncbi:MAG TPA: folate-binding protein [Sphingomicrobium sp.]